MKKKLCLLLSGIMIFSLVGCGSDNKKEDSSNKKESTNVSENDENVNQENNETFKDITNPFDIEEEIISSETVLLDGYNCKVQLYTLENCRLMLSSNYGKDENAFSFIGYVYEKDTNIPDAIFVDYTSEINNSNIYAVGLIAGKEGLEKEEANPAIAQYKYSKTSENTAVITDMQNQAIGSVQDEYAKEINDRVDRFKNMIQK